MSTFKRQVIFDLTFLVENIVMLMFGCLTDIEPLNEMSTIQWFVGTVLMFHMIGLVLEVIYYTVFHLWKDINVKIDLCNGRVYKHQLGAYTARRERHLGECPYEVWI